MKIPKAKRPPEKILNRIQALPGKQGEVAVIEPESGDYFLGETLTETLREAKKKYPGKIFYSVRVGSSFLYEHKGGMRSR